MIIITHLLPHYVLNVMKQHHKRFFDSRTGVGFKKQFFTIVFLIMFNIFTFFHLTNGVCVFFCPVHINNNEYFDRTKFKNWLDVLFHLQFKNTNQRCWCGGSMTKTSLEAWKGLKLSCLFSRIHWTIWDPFTSLAVQSHSLLYHTKERFVFAFSYYSVPTRDKDWLC